MKYIVNPKDFEFGGHLQGYMNITYKELKEKLGVPSDRYDDYKCDAEWQVEFEDGTSATIYNYKDGVNYLGKDGTPKTKITNWHIGGTTPRAKELVYQLFGINSHFVKVEQ